jgi:hypothetical protein
VKNMSSPRISSDSWVCCDCTARVNWGPEAAWPGARAIFLMLARTSLARPAFLSTSMAVTRSVNASTPLRRKIVSPSTGVEVLSSWSTVRVTSGRSCSMAPSMLATRVAVRRRADTLLCSTSRSDSRRTVQIVEAPKPMMSTTTMRTEILTARRPRSIAGDPIM